MAHDPNRRRRVNGVYGSLMELQSRIDELKQYGDSADDEELDRLTQEQHDILSQFDHVMEAGARRAAVDELVPRSGRYWADEYDDDDSDFYNESYLIGSLLDASADASIEFSDETSTAASSNGDVEEHEEDLDSDTDATWVLPKRAAPRGKRWVSGGYYSYYSARKKARNVPHTRGSL